MSVEYSERTGALVAIERLGVDMRTGGRFVWPPILLVAVGTALVNIRRDFRGFHDARLLVLFTCLLLVVGPLLGQLAVDALSTTLDTLYKAPT